jgi:hypothetical protein
MHPVPSPPTMAFVSSAQTRHSHPSHKSVSCWGAFRSFTTVRSRYDLLIVHPPDGSDRISIRPSRIFTTGPSTVWPPAPSPVIATGGNWVISTGGTHTPLEWQLASLHAEAVPFHQTEFSRRLFTPFSNEVS